MDEQQLETALALYCSAVPIVQWSTNKSLARQMIWRKLMRSSALNCIYLTSQLRNPIEPTQMLEQVWLCHGHFCNALNKTFMESEGIGQLSRFHCIINYGTQIMSLKKSQSATNIWNFP